VKKGIFPVFQSRSTDTAEPSRSGMPPCYRHLASAPGCNWKTHLPQPTASQSDFDEEVANIIEWRDAIKLLQQGRIDFRHHDLNC